MRLSAAFSDIGYRVEDGDIGYAGDTHLSFKPHAVPSAAHIRATEQGDAALQSIHQILRERAGAHGAGQSTTPRRLSVTSDAYWAAISRVVRGF